MIFEKVRELLAEQLEINEEDITPETRIMEDLHADSLDIVELIMTLEGEYNLVITDEEAATCRTVGEVAEYIEKVLDRQGK